MRVYCVGTAKIEHSKSGKQYQISAVDLHWKSIGGAERKMGPEQLYEAALTHPELGELRWSLAEYPTGVENHKGVDVGNHRILKNFDYGLVLDADYETEKSDNKNGDNSFSIEKMVQWFHEFYEDPQQETPFDSEEGGYIYVYGGPFDARDVLQEEFGNRASERDIEKAIEEVESGGIFEWAPSPRHPEQQRVAEEHEEEWKRERRTGSGLFVRREAQNLILNRESLALGLAHLFQTAKGEFSFALLGSWGSGKTRLAETISDFLSDPELYRRSIKNAFGFAELDLKQYSIVKFNAWKYQKKPELWVYLYESFLTEYLRANLFERTLRIVRLGLQRHGLANALISWLVLAISAFPLFLLFELYPVMRTFVSLSGLVGLVFLLHRWRASLRELYDRYGVVSSHGEHLGMQAVIGEDLKALVRSQVSGEQFSKTEKWVSGIVVFALVICGLMWANLAEIGGSKLPIFVALTILSLIGLLFLSAMNWNRDRVDRILLIVDDLDRCAEREILDLIDGVKLMVDDEEIGEFVQVLTLADTDVLYSAIEAKFGLKHHSGSPTWKSVEKVVEHTNKVFLCSLNLPDISGDEVADLVRGYANEFGVEDRDHEPNERQNAPREASRSFTGRPIHEAVPEVGDFVLSQSEVEFIQAALEKHVGAYQISMTPRTVRSYLFKYQILRMILRSNEVDYEPQLLAQVLSREIALSLGREVQTVSEVPPSLLHYAKMVV